jgi:hypothetical protein
VAAALGGASAAAVGCSDLIGLHDLPPGEVDAGEASADAGSPEAGPGDSTIPSTDTATDSPTDSTADSAAPEDAPADGLLDSTLDAFPTDAPGDTATVDAPGDAAPVVDASDGGCGPGMGLCNGKCVPSTQNPNCGECGASYTCSAGTCDSCNPVLLANEAAYPDPFEIAVDSNNVYWTNRLAQTVSACAIGGCGGRPTALATGQTGVYSIGVDGTAVFWTVPNAIRACSGSGCSNAPSTLTSTAAAPQYLVVGLGTVYWIEGGTSVQSCSTHSGCASSTPIATGLSAAGGKLVADASNLYWLNDSNTMNATLVSCPLGGCGTSPTPLGSISSPSGLAVTGGNLYTLVNLGLMPPNSPHSEALQCSVSGCGTNPKVLSGSENEPFQIATDGSSVYWTSGDGTIKRCSIPGCPAGPTTVVRVPWGLYGIAVDSAHIYWTDQVVGHVMQLDK